ncbi:hypothetical protein, partial [Carboxylicivirga linearis]
VAFEVRDALGMPQNFNGLVVDENDQIVTAAKTMWRGKGVFNINPQPGKQYFIKELGQTDTLNGFPLPNALSEGWVMNVVDQGKEYPLAITISKSGSIADTTLFLLATQNGMAKDALIINMSGRVILTTELAKTEFNSGIVQLTLFDQNQMARTERLVFIKKEDALNISIKEDKLPKGSRDSVLLTMLVTSQEGDPVEGNFSIAVTDATRVPDKAYGSANINQYVSLYSDLPGLKLNDPVLFEDTGEGNFKSELLMLTNGWRRYQWEEVLTDAIIVPEYEEEPGLYVQGKVRSLWRKEKIPEGIDVSMIAGSVFEHYNDKLDENGEFTFIMKDFNDTKRVVLQTKNKKDKKHDYRLDIKNSYQHRLTDQYDYLEKAYLVNNEEEMTDATEEVTIEKQVLERELDRVVLEDTFVVTTDYSIKEVEKKAELEKSPKGQMNERYGAPEYSIGEARIQELMEEKSWYNGIFSLLYDEFPNLRISVSSRPSKISASYDRNGAISYNVSPAGPPTIWFQFIGIGRHQVYMFIDGEMVASGDLEGSGVINGYLTMDDLMSLDPKEVKSVDLLFPKSPSTRGELLNDFTSREVNVLGVNEPMSTLEGRMGNVISATEVLALPTAILSIYTKSGGGIYSTIAYKGLSNFTIQGFKKIKDFYHLDYSTGLKDSVWVDERNTLAWYPNVETDYNGKADLKFYSSNISNKIRLEVNGVSNVGELGSLVYNTQDSLFIFDSDMDSRRKIQDIQVKNKQKGPRVVLSSRGPAVYAHISNPDRGWSTFTSADGQFKVNNRIINENSDLLIEKAGYNNVSTTFLDLLNQEEAILEKADINLVSIKATDIVKKLYRNRFRNRNSTTLYSKGAYREKLFDGESLHQLSDYGFIQEWPNMAERQMYIDSKITGGREFNSMDVNKKVNFIPMNRGEIIPNFDPLYYLHSFLDLSLYKDYEYTLVGEVEFQGRMMYHIQFDQKEGLTYTYYQGDLLVDAETYGLAWAKWRISDKGMKYVMPDMYLVCDFTPDQFELNNEYREMTWRFNGVNWEPDFAIYNVSFDLNGETKRIEQEIIWKVISKFEYKEKDSQVPKEWHKTATLQKNNEYNPEQWRDSWMLPPDKNINEQIKYLNEMISYE